MRFDDLVITKWQARFQGRVFPVAIGRGGIGVKKGEGDGITPIGIHLVETWLYRADRMNSQATPILANSGWCDAPEDRHYNRMISRPYHASHEALFRPDHVYDLIGVLNYNRNPVISGKGSAIFLHQWRRPRYPTAGCIAFAPQDLRFIASRWLKNSRVVVTA